MRKLFGANKKKKPSKLKTSALKIPIPMINGVEYADLTESQISTLIGGRNKGYREKKLTTSLSSQRTNNTIQTEKTPSNVPVQQQPVTPSRSISSPPILVMPKPMHSLPPTRYLLGNYNYEKTQVENSISSSDEEQEEEEEQIMSSPLPSTTEKEVDEENKNYQSSTYVTRTSDDSMRQYVSASESPFLTTSSAVSSMNHQKNTDAPLFPPFSSPSSSSFVQYTSTGNDMNNIGNNAPRLVTCSSVPPPSTSTITAAVPNLNDMQDIYKPPSANSNEAVIQEFPLPPSNIYSTEDTNRNLPPINEYNNISTTPIPIPTKRKVSRPPTSSSGSSATVGHDVTHSQSRFVNNNSDKPPGTLLQTVSSESSAFNQNNNNNRMDSLTEMLQTEIKKMALNEDLIELKRTVDRMQQQRVSDLEDHLTRVAEQKLREKEILEQIKLTKQKLDMAIAERMFTNNNKEEEEANQRLPMQPADVNVPPMKSSNSTNTIRSNKLKSSASVSGGAASGSGNNNSSRHNQQQQQQQQQQQPPTNRQRNRRSFPSAYQRLPAQNEYFPDMSKPNFDFSYPSQYGYPQDYNPEIDMMRMMNGSQNHFADPFGMDSPGLRYPRRKSSLQRRPRSKSMESQWQEQQELENQYMQQHHQHPDMYQDGDSYYPTPRTRSRKSSLRSAKSSSSDSDNNNNKKSDFHDNFDQPATANEEEKRSTSGRQPEMGSDEDRHHSARHRNGSGRFRRGYPHPGNMGNMPPNMFGYPNGPPPLPHPMDRERMKMRPPPPPPHYGYNNMPPPPPGNEYFSYMPPSQRISPRMMAALAADEQNQQQQQQQQPYGGYQWGQGMYGMPPPPPPDNAGTGANLTCEQQDQPAFGVRRFPPPPPPPSAAGGQQQSAPLQQTPQPPPPPPPQGYFNVW